MAREVTRSIMPMETSADRAAVQLDACGKLEMAASGRTETPTTCPRSAPKAIYDRVCRVVPKETPVIAMVERRLP